MRRSYARAELVDQFPVFDADGFEKVSGLGAGAFRATVYRDTEVVDAEVEITEIDDSPGEYRFALSPHAPGVWEIEIAYEAGRQVYSGQYQIVEPMVVGSSRPPGWG